MTPSEFANKLRTKYPGQYDDMSDGDLTSKVLSKHPEYGDMVETAPPAVTSPQPSFLDKVKQNVIPDLKETLTPWPLKAIRGVEDMAIESNLTGKSPLAQMWEGMIQPIVHPVDYTAEHPVSQLINLGLIGSDAPALISAVKEGTSNIASKIGGTFAEKPAQTVVDAAEDAVTNSLNKAKDLTTSKLNAVKEQFSTPPNFEDVSDVGEPKPSLKDLKTKYVDYFKSRAPQMEETGMTAPEGTSIQRPPNVEVYIKGIQKGINGAEEPIYGVRGDPKVLEEHFGDPDPGSVRKDILQQKGLLDNEGKPITTVQGPQFSSPKEEIGHLINLRQGLQDEIRSTIVDQSGQVVKKVGTVEEGKIRNMIGNINDKIAGLPGGDAIRDAESHWSEARSAFDDLQSKMSEPGKASQFLKNLFSKPTGKNLDYINKLGVLQNMTGEKVLDNLFGLYKQAAQGISYEELKHPLASLTKNIVPQISDTVRPVGSMLSKVTGKGLQGFPLSQENKSELQSVRDRLNNAK